METAGTTGLGSSFGLGFRGTIPKLVSLAEKMISRKKIFGEINFVVSISLDVH